MAGKRTASGTKERLSRETIVDSAVALADAEGLDAVTIRRLATDHGVTPMALYWHFKDKDLLLDGLVERVLNEVELPGYPEGEPAPWEVRLRDCYAALLSALSRHPELAGLVHERILGCQAGLDFAEMAFAALREAGFDDTEMSWIGIQSLHELVVLVTHEPGERLLKRTEAELAERLRQKRIALEVLEPERYPNIVHCAPVLVGVPEHAAAYRELGLDILIEGIRARAAKLV